MKGLHIGRVTDPDSPREERIKDPHRPILLRAPKERGGVSLQDVSDDAFRVLGTGCRVNWGDCMSSEGSKAGDFAHW